MIVCHVAMVIKQGIVQEAHITDVVLLTVVRQAEINARRTENVQAATPLKEELMTVIFAVKAVEEVHPHLHPHLRLVNRHAALGVKEKLVKEPGVIVNAIMIHLAVAGT